MIRFYVEYDDLPITGALLFWYSFILLLKLLARPSVVATGFAAAFFFFFLDAVVFESFYSSS